jgi:hypothetical protein
MLSRPHPMALARAMANDPEHSHRSRHHKAFLEPDAGPRLLANNAEIMRTRLVKGVPAAAIEQHMSVLASPPAIEAALAWYRARRAPAFATDRGADAVRLGRCRRHGRPHGRRGDR